MKIPLWNNNIYYVGQNFETFSVELASHENNYRQWLVYFTALIDATKKKDENDIQLLISSIAENEKEVKKKCKENKKKFKTEDGYKHHLSYEMSEARKVMRVVASGRNKNRQAVPQSLSKYNCYLV